MNAEATSFHGRRAVRIANGEVELLVLPGGGHVAQFQLLDRPLNPLWEPPWKSIEPESYDPLRCPEYGESEGRLLASIAGHSLCLNHYGEASPGEQEVGGYVHGEAPNLPWIVAEYEADPRTAQVTYGVDLPEAGMRMTRKITLAQDDTIARFDEEITNVRRADSPLFYQQHVTLGPPFVEPGVTRLDLPHARAHTYPRSLGAMDPLTPDREFTWPAGPGLSDLDLFPRGRPLSTLCTVALDAAKPAFVAMSNPEVGLLLAYVFSGDVFPWVALWYENRGIAEPPYGGKTVAWGIEFGTCPLPVPRTEALAAGPLLDRPRFGLLPALRTLRTSYYAILQRVPPDWTGVEGITRASDGFVISERGGRRKLRARTML
jgi:hypothetical protein